MSCWHGCRTWCGPCAHGWYAAPMWGIEEYEDLPMLRRARRRDRRSALTREEGVRTLEARLEELRDELRRVESTLAKLQEMETEREDALQG